MRGFQSYLRNCITDLNRKLGYIQSIHLKFPGKTLYQITNFHTQEVINLYGYDFKKNKTRLDSQSHGYSLFLCVLVFSCAAICEKEFNLNNCGISTFNEITSKQNTLGTHFQLGRFLSKLSGNCELKRKNSVVCRVSNLRNSFGNIFHTIAT